jgi:glutaminyl-tRNA synthetase
MPTIRGLRRRGYTAEAINNFCDKIGVTRNENIISINLLEHYCREDLDVRASRAMAVLDPLKVVITNWEGNTPEKHAKS